VKTIFFKNIPDDIFRMFKAACAERGQTMKEVFIKLMIEFCKK